MVTYNGIAEEISQISRKPFLRFPTEILVYLLLIKNRDRYEIFLYKQANFAI